MANTMLEPPSTHGSDIGSRLSVVRTEMNSPEAPQEFDVEVGCLIEFILCQCRTYRDAFTLSNQPTSITESVLLMIATPSLLSYPFFVAR